jgi:hypothetical protein
LRCSEVKTAFLGAHVRPDAFTSRQREDVGKSAAGFWSFFTAEVPRRLPLSEDVVTLLDETPSTSW